MSSGWNERDASGEPRWFPAGRDLRDEGAGGSDLVAARKEERAAEHARRLPPCYGGHASPGSEACRTAVEARTVEIEVIGVPTQRRARITPGRTSPPPRSGPTGCSTGSGPAASTVHDAGDVAGEPFRRDPVRAAARNLDAVVRVAALVADEVERVLAAGRFALVLGGDCTIELGVVAGAQRALGDVRLAYLDGDADLASPEPSGQRDPRRLRDRAPARHRGRRPRPARPAVPDARRPAPRDDRLRPRRRGLGRRARAARSAGPAPHRPPLARRAPERRRAARRRGARARRRLDRRPLRRRHDRLGRPAARELPALRHRGAARDGDGGARGAASGCPGSAR